MLQKQTTGPSHNNNKKKGEGISFFDIYIIILATQYRTSRNEVRATYKLITQEYYKSTFGK